MVIDLIKKRLAQRSKEREEYRKVYDKERIVQSRVKAKMDARNYKSFGEKAVDFTSKVLSENKKRNKGKGLFESDSNPMRDALYDNKTKKKKSKPWWMD